MRQQNVISNCGVRLQKKPPLAFIVNNPVFRPVITTAWPQWFRELVYGKPDISNYGYGVNFRATNHMLRVTVEDEEILNGQRLR